MYFTINTKLRNESFVEFAIPTGPPHSLVPLVLAHCVGVVRSDENGYRDAGYCADVDVRWGLGSGAESEGGGLALSFSEIVCRSQDRLIRIR